MTRSYLAPLTCQSTSPFSIMTRRGAASTTPRTLPRPPWMATPPMTAAAIAEFVAHPHRWLHRAVLCQLEYAGHVDEYSSHRERSKPGPRLGNADQTGRTRAAAHREHLSPPTGPFEPDSTAEDRGDKNPDSPAYAQKGSCRQGTEGIGQAGHHASSGDDDEQPAIDCHCSEGDDDRMNPSERQSFR